MEHYHATVGRDHPAAVAPEIGPLVTDAAHGVLAHYHRSGNYFIYSRPYDPVIEQIANARGITSEWHQMLTGFVGGFPVCLALLHAETLTAVPEAQSVAVRVADRICAEGISPSGFFWADFVPRKVESANGSFPNPLFTPGRNTWGSGWLSGTTRVHSRTISDACACLARMIPLREQAGEDASQWRQALESNVRAVLDLQLPNGSYGQYYDAVERTVVKEDGCGGLPWIPALLHACRLRLGGRHLCERMETSLRRAAVAYAPYIEAESIWGAPEDNDSPTSEDGMNAVIAYADLYETTQDERHLHLACIAADWMLTFRKTYNELLPPQSLMGCYGMRSKGGDYASASNNHLHVFEVLCTRQLCNLTRWTGNAYYRERAKDHWGFVCQHLSRCDGMFNGFRGAAAEQFYWSDYGSWGHWLPPTYHRQKGNMAPFTAIWCIAVILLAAPDAQREAF
jgi:rhamnogalacturonyl hydrolase YesR